MTDSRSGIGITHDQAGQFYSARKYKMWEKKPQANKQTNKKKNRNKKMGHVQETPGASGGRS